MFSTWLIAAAFIGGVLAGAFFDEIMNWAKDRFNSLSNGVKKAWVYIRRIPRGIKQMIRYIQNGRMIEDETPREMEWVEIVRMHENGEIDDETFNALKHEQDKKIAELERNR